MGQIILNHKVLMIILCGIGCVVYGVYGFDFWSHKSKVEPETKSTEDGSPNIESIAKEFGRSIRGCRFTETGDWSPAYEEYDLIANRYGTGVAIKVIQYIMDNAPTSSTFMDALNVLHHALPDDEDDEVCISLWKSITEKVDLFDGEDREDVQYALIECAGDWGFKELIPDLAKMKIDARWLDRCRNNIIECLRRN